MINKKKVRKGSKTSRLVKVLTASLVLNPALYMLTFEKAFVEAVSTASYKAPYVSKALPNFHTGVGIPLTLNLNEYFDGINSYSVSASNLTGFTATINGSSLILTNTRTGTATVSVTGTAANGGTVSDTFDVAVIPESLDKDGNGQVDISEIVSYAGSHSMTRDILQDTLSFIVPQKLTSPNTAPKSLDTSITVYKNSPTTLSPADLFSDEDALIIVNNSISLSPTGYATVNATNNQLTVTALQHGSTIMDIAVRDGRGGKASNRYNITVGNRAPIFTGSDVTVTTNTYSPTIDLHTLFNDPDGDPLQFGTVQVSSSSPNPPVQLVRTDDTFKLYGIATGSATVTANASDAYGGMTTGSFNVTVTNATYVNHPPQYNSASNKLVNRVIDPSIESNAYNPFTIDLTNAFTDPDNDNLTYSVASSTASIAAASISGNLLTVTPQGAAHGKTTVTVTANDNRGGIVSYGFDVLFNSVPTFTGSLVPSSYSIQHTMNAIAYIGGFHDADNDNLVYSAISDLGDSLSVTTALSSSGARAYISGLSRGTHTVTLTATDPFGGNRTASFSVEVKNNAPMVKRPISVINGQSVAIVADDIFNDIDGDSMSLTAFQSISTSGLVTTSFASGTLYVTGIGVGSGSIAVTVNDYHGGVITTEYGYTPIPEGLELPFKVYNPLPDVQTSPNLTKKLDLSSYFSEFTSFTVVSSDSNIAQVSGPLGTDYNLTAGSTMGTATITVKAYDSYGEALTTTFQFNVSPP
ncbi:Ig-like domain-containing protein [Paenibacillus periandrae]|uniref:Ig-like domain-containing protein n=1 Tax=Paenibacillus periandrae TaxID=1761741 RepID=UPI001F098FEE|nr:Ig-like domain-containing protein [Paenibacillus periandrae]